MSWLTGHMQNPKNHQPMCILSAVLKKGKENPSEAKCKEWKLDLKVFFLSFQRRKIYSTLPEPWIGGFWELGRAGLPHGAAWRWGFGIGKVPAGSTSCCFYSLQQSILPAWPRRMSSPWVPTCRYGHRWTRSSISPCCCSWRSAGPLPPPSCRTTARSTPSSPTRGETLGRLHGLRTMEVFLTEFAQVHLGRRWRTRQVPPSLPLVRAHPSFAVVQASRRQSGENWRIRSEWNLHGKCWPGCCAAQIYIHCNLLAWDPEVLNEDKKACNYVKQTRR